MNIQFTKMHGLGNDFMVINAIHQPIKLSPEQIRNLARRDRGIGFDQCLIVEPSNEEGIDFFYRIFNADGREVGQCGNGARCLARFIAHYQLSSKKHLTIKTTTTQLELVLNDDKTVTVCFDRPKLAPADIPLQMPYQASHYSLPLTDGTSYSIHAIHVGNPHAVISVPLLDNQPVAEIGKAISEHPLFPEQANVGFMQIMNAGLIHLRVYERGCGETNACGSGAVAAAAVGRLYYDMASQICVKLPGGELLIHWPDKHGPIYLTGPATFVYEGVLIND